MKGPHICSSDVYDGSDKIAWEENMERQGKQHICTRICMGAPTFQFHFIPFLQGLVLILIYGNILSWQEKFTWCFPAVLVNIKLLLWQHCTSNERCLLSQGNLSEVGDQCLKRDQGHATWLLLPVAKKKIMWTKFGKKNTRLSPSISPSSSDAKWNTLLQKDCLRGCHQHDIHNMAKKVLMEISSPIIQNVFKWK